MLEADKINLHQDLKLSLVHIEDRELRFIASNAATISTQAALLSGFAFSALVQVNVQVDGNRQPISMQIPWTISTVAAMLLEIMSLVKAVQLSITGPGLALRGPEGSMTRAITVMRIEYRRIHQLFYAGLFFFLISSVLYVWITFDDIPAVIVTVMVFLTLVWLYTELRSVSTKLSFDFALEERGEKKRPSHWLPRVLYAPGGCYPSSSSRKPTQGFATRAFGGAMAGAGGALHNAIGFMGASPAASSSSASGPSAYIGSRPPPATCDDLETGPVAMGRGFMPAGSSLAEEPATPSGLGGWIASFFGGGAPDEPRAPIEVELAELGGSRRHFKMELPSAATVEDMWSATAQRLGGQASTVTIYLKEEPAGRVKALTREQRDVPLSSLLSNGDNTLRVAAMQRELPSEAVMATRSRKNGRRGSEYTTAAQENPSTSSQRWRAAGEELLRLKKRSAPQGDESRVRSISQEASRPRSRTNSKTDRLPMPPLPVDRPHTFGARATTSPACLADANTMPTPPASPRPRRSNDQRVVESCSAIASRRAPPRCRDDSGQTASK